jgi:putative glutamine amidotransferase
MPVVASWIREKDEPWFGGSFAILGQDDLVLQNARRGEAIDLKSVDAVLLTGGEDICAGHLRQPVPDPSLIEDPVPERDEWEFAAVAAAMERGIPLLGVCKGHQVINVALGGTLHLDIRGHDLPEQKSANIQSIRHDAGNPAAWRYGSVNSSHHQAIDRLGDGLEVLAWSATDGIIEQVRSRTLPWCVGVQYHPERDPAYYQALFADFVGAIPG